MRLLTAVFLMSSCVLLSPKIAFSQDAVNPLSAIGRSNDPTLSQRVIDNNRALNSLIIQNAISARQQGLQQPPLQAAPTNESLELQLAIEKAKIRRLELQLKLKETPAETRAGSSSVPDFGP